MKRYSWRWAAGLAPLCGLVLWATLPAAGQAPSFNTQNGEWPTFGGDLKSDRYSPLDQINGDNFNKIEVAWRAIGGCLFFVTSRLVRGTLQKDPANHLPLQIVGILEFHRAAHRDPGRGGCRS